MNRDTIYVFENGHWIYGADYTILAHKPLGKYQEFNIGLGFQSHEVDEMVEQYLFDLWNDEDN